MLQLAEMARLGVQPDNIAATALLDACARNRKMEMASSVFEELFGAAALIIVRSGLRICRSVLLQWQLRAHAVRSCLKSHRLSMCWWLPGLHPSPAHLSGTCNPGQLRRSLSSDEVGPMHACGRASSR